MTRQHLVDQGLLIVETSRSYSDTPHSVGIVWTSDQPDVETSTTYNTHKRQTSMPPAGFEPTISAGERPQTHTVGRAATGIGFWLVTIVPKYWNFPSSRRIFTRNGMSFCLLLERYGRTHCFLDPSSSTSFLTSNRVILPLLLCSFGRIINE